MMRAPMVVWVRTRSNSSGESFPGFRSTASGPDLAQVVAGGGPSDQVGPVVGEPGGMAAHAV
jgi:hypothetical protein